MTTSYEPSAWDPWNYSQSSGFTAGSGVSLVDYDVEATDGRIGKIDEATDAVDDSYVVVDTGPWIFGRKVVIPAKAIARLDIPDEKVYLRLKKDQIKDSPEFDKSTDPDRRREQIGAYYGPIF